MGVRTKEGGISGPQFYHPCLFLPLCQNDRLGHWFIITQAQPPNQTFCALLMRGSLVFFCFPPRNKVHRRVCACVCVCMIVLCTLPPVERQTTGGPRRKRRGIPFDLAENRTDVQRFFSLSWFCHWYCVYRRLRRGEVSSIRGIWIATVGKIKSRRGDKHTPHTRSQRKWWCGGRGR